MGHHELDEYAAKHGYRVAFDGLRVVQAVFGATLALSIYLFVYNMLRTLVK